MSTRPRKTSAQLLVRRLNDSATTALLEFGGRYFACALGRGGIRSRKREGDGATPRGRFRLVAAYYDPRHLRTPETALPVRALQPSDGWCDAPHDRNYNRHVRHPYPSSAERLWRDDGLYDVVIVLDYNLVPRSRGKGSAIFMHIARPGLQPTEGCIALRRHDLLKVLRALPSRGACVVTER